MTQLTTRLALTIDFGVPKKNIKDSIWYKKPKSEAVQEEALGTTIDPIKVMRQVRRDSQEKDFAPAGHWECSKTTFEDLINLPYFRQMYTVATRPDISDKGMQLAFANLVPDETIKTFIETRIGAEIRIVDSISVVEKYDKSSKAIQYKNLQSFEEGVLAYVPNEDLGDVQCGRPISMETPGARTALYDGGRTLIRQVFNDETMTQVIKSEVTGLVVPNKVRWFYYLNIKGK